MENKCPLCYMSTAKHCEAAACTWRRCIRCRGFGVVGGDFRPYDPAPKLEELYATLAIKDEDRNPPAPVLGSD